MANYKKNTRDLSWYSRSTPLAEGVEVEAHSPTNRDIFAVMTL